MKDERSRGLNYDSTTLECCTETPRSTTVANSARLLHVGARAVLVAAPSMLQLHNVVARIARTSMPVLIRGETGTGKEIVAEAIHLLSDRALKQFVRLNCAAMPATLLESELFGYERGAFTGAVKAKPGLLAEATGGTFFFDEIGEMPEAVQVKLLRVLEDGRVRRVGAVKEHQIDIRIIAATNRDLKAMLTAGAFRKDLYYRLSNFVLEVPPLRERRAEISLLAEHYLTEICRATNRLGVSLGPDVTAILEAYEWPGNVRELRNVIGRAIVLCDSQITSAHLPEEVRSTPLAGQSSHQADVPLRLVPDGRPLREQLRDVERRRIVNALETSNWNRTHAAKALQMPRRTLVWKLGSLGIELPRRAMKNRRASIA